MTESPPQRHRRPGRELAEVTAVSMVLLLLLAGVVWIGTVKWRFDCYSAHAGEQVRWTFPNGCEVSYAGTYLTVGTD